MEELGSDIGLSFAVQSYFVLKGGASFLTGAAVPWFLVVFPPSQCSGAARVARMAGGETPVKCTVPSGQLGDCLETTVLGRRVL